VARLVLALANRGGGALVLVTRTVGVLARASLRPRASPPAVPVRRRSTRRARCARLDLLDLARSRRPIHCDSSQPPPRARLGEAVALLGARRVGDAAFGERRVVSRHFARRLADAQRERIELALAARARRAQLLEALPERFDLDLEPLGFGDQFRAFRNAPFVRLAGRLHAFAYALEVLLVVRDGERRRVVAVAQVVELVRRCGCRIALGVFPVATRPRCWASAATSCSNSRSSRARWRGPSRHRFRRAAPSGPSTSPAGVTKVAGARALA
jgi:hypothetical protein